MKTKNVLTSAVAGLTVLPLSAAVTYVDASISNTVGAASSLVDWNDGSAGAGDGSASNDGLWRYRGSFGNSGVWEATGSSAASENAVEILTSATVSNGTYNVFVFFKPVTVGAGDFPIRAGLVSNPSGNQVYDQLGAAGVAGKDALVGADALTFAGTAPSEGSRPLLYGELSQATVTDGVLRVYVDDFPALGTTNSSNSRTWYEGIGYEAIPEPSTSLLGALGVLSLLGFRRR